MNENVMITGKPGRTLFFFALPMILGNLFQQLYTMADSAIVGRFVGEEALAAVGASYSFTNVFIMVAIGAGIGASVLTSQYLGAGEYHKMKTSVYTFLLAFLAVSLILAGVGFAFNPGIMQALKTPENIMNDAVLYLQIYFVGLPFLFMYNILSATFNALGKSKIPLYFLIFSSVLNVGLDLWMVIRLNLGVAGVAIATVIAQGVSALISFFVLLYYLQKFPVPAGKTVRVFDRKMLAKGTKIAIPSTVQQSIVSIGMLLVQSVVNGFGSAVVAGYAAGTRVESLCIVPMIATGNAVSTFTAQNIGARRSERVKEGLRAGYALTAVFAVLICVVLNLFHAQILSVFIDQESGPLAFLTGDAYITFISWFFICIGLKSSTDGVLRGAGDMWVYMAANLINLGIRVSVAQLFAPVWGVQAVWFAIPMGWTVNFLISFGWYLSGKWSKHCLV